MARAKRALEPVAAYAWTLGRILFVLDFCVVVPGAFMDAESAWFSEGVELFGRIAAIVLVVVIVGGAISILAVYEGARKPLTWAMGVLFALALVQLTLVAGTMTTEFLTLRLSTTPHRLEAKFYSAGPVGIRRHCAQRIQVQPLLPRFEERTPGFCAPDAVVEPGLKRDDKVVLVGRASRLGFVVERVERAP